MYKEVNGDLIELALAGEFEVIAHGCNCFCTMGAGIAPVMKQAFNCDSFPMERHSQKGNINKLGNIDFEYNREHNITVVNCYTQYRYDRNSKPFDYEAFTLCMRKMNHCMSGAKIGLPQIGAGLAGGDWEIIKQIIIKELKDCDVTVVIYNK